MIPLTYMMSLSSIIFAIGVAGVIIRRNILVMYMSIELMLNAVNLAFIAIGSRLGSMDGQVIVFFVMTVAAAESAVGLGIIATISNGFVLLDISPYYQSIIKGTIIVSALALDTGLTRLARAR